MAVIVNDDMPIELALKMLWREANREGIPEIMKKRRYYWGPSELKHVVVAALSKRWRRSRSAARRARSKKAY